MNTSDFYFNLPDELIAQSPIDSRDKSRLLCMARHCVSGNENDTGVLDHRHFYELPDLLNPGDCLVLNDSRVLPARLIGERSTGGSVEVLLVRNTTQTQWECLVRPGKKVTPGSVLYFGRRENPEAVSRQGEFELTATVISVLNDGNRLIEFHFDGNFPELIDRIGQMPLPPYISGTLADRERYQTVYSKDPGSVAAPTAGLHFTGELLTKLKDCNILTTAITLHVGPGTFRPVKSERIEDHTMHSEWFSVSQAAADLINGARAAGGRIIAVGTTACRTLESVCDLSGQVHAGSGSTDIFIYPGYEFRCVDGLITNFHLPGSTLIMLVSAFAGRERVLYAYNEAIAKGYRFYSFGDAMFIL